MEYGLFPVEKMRACLLRCFSNPQGYSLDKKMVLDITIDSRENVWFATYGMGAVVFNWNDKQFKGYQYSKQNPRCLSTIMIFCAFSKIIPAALWFGTDGAGLSFYDAYLEKFNYFLNQQVPENINIDVVRALFVDENENVWIGTSGKGLTEYNPLENTWKTYISREYGSANHCQQPRNEPDGGWKRKALDGLPGRWALVFLTSAQRYLHIMIPAAKFHCQPIPSGKFCKTRKEDSGWPPERTD
jgi:hypothetical protein